MPGFDLPVPQNWASPGARISRCLELSLNSAWFVITTRRSDPEGGTATFLLAWDGDVVDMLNSTGSMLESLLFVAPYLSGSGRGWYSRKICEVWQAFNPSRFGENPCVLLIGEDGEEYSGVFMEQAVGVTRHRLLARIRRA